MKGKGKSPLLPFSKFAIAHKSNLISAKKLGGYSCHIAAHLRRWFSADKTLFHLKASSVCFLGIICFVFRNSFPMQVFPSVELIYKRTLSESNGPSLDIWKFLISKALLPIVGFHCVCCLIAWSILGVLSYVALFRW